MLQAEMALLAATGLIPLYTLDFLMSSLGSGLIQVLAIKILPTTEYVIIRCSITLLRGRLHSYWI